MPIHRCMQTRLASVFLVLLTLCAAGRADAQFRAQQPLPPPEDFHVEVGAMLWTPTPELTIDNDQLNSATGGGVDLVKEFNLQNVRFTELRLTLKPARNHKIEVSHVPAEYTATATLQRTITYKGVTFPITVPATADVKWDIWRLGYEYDFVNNVHGLAGFITELKYNRVTGTITSATASASIDQTAPVPALGLILRGYVQKYISISGEFTGFKIPHVHNFDGKAWDFDIYATGSITKYFGVQGGYRSVIVNYDVNSDTGDLKLKGPYFGGMVRF